uniref:Uncharacterized protein n=1 Tax=viral metagenome TaxID=1070528 RepID=A0A6M3KSX1_9ZZZZ
MDIMTRFSNAQDITVDVVSDIVLSFGSDAARNVFFRGDRLLKIKVTTTFATLTEGIRVEFRFDTEAGLASGSEIVIADSGILLPANLTEKDLYQVMISPRSLPSGYDFCGVFYNVVSTAATAGAFTTWLADGPEVAGNVDS